MSTKSRPGRAARGRAASLVRARKPHLEWLHLDTNVIEVSAKPFIVQGAKGDGDTDRNGRDVHLPIEG
jgi:hypothetical protein